MVSTFSPAWRVLAASSLGLALAACSSGSIDDQNAGGDDAASDPTGDASGDGHVTPGTDGAKSDTAPASACSGKADGDWCGTGTDASTLYHCKGGVETSKEICKTGCYDRLGAGKSACGSDAVDPCFNDPDGDYCGSAIGATGTDAGKLFHCKDKHTVSADTCPDGCFDVTGVGGDKCASDAVDPCFNDGDGAYCGDSIGATGANASKVYHCAGHRTASTEDCPDGCSHNPPGVPDTCAGVLACSNVQWWNSALTYGPYMSYGWWDTDLAVATHTKVQLRHASRLDKHGVYGWGFMPEFTDQVTGKRFRFLHLQVAPSLQYANVDGTIYPAGFVVGLSGGDTADTGLGTYSTGAHLCVQTLDTYRNCFPTGKDPCK
jgi:hypothetical protein